MPFSRVAETDCKNRLDNTQNKQASICRYLANKFIQSQYRRVELARKISCSTFEHWVLSSYLTKSDSFNITADLILQYEATSLTSLFIFLRTTIQQVICSVVKHFYHFEAADHALLGKYQSFKQFLNYFVSHHNITLEFLSQVMHNFRKMARWSRFGLDNLNMWICNISARHLIITRLWFASCCKDFFFMISRNAILCFVHLNVLLMTTRLWWNRWPFFF